MATTPENRASLEARYKKISSNLGIMTIILVICAGVVVFLPGWILDMIERKGRTSDNPTASIYDQYGIQALFIAIGCVLFFMLIMLVISGWFGLRRKVRSTRL